MVPVHAGDTLHPKPLKSILLQANMTVDDLRALL
jgi:predicted RNA binding protein YcfA (HicA-like mRNA interferase family)